MTNSNESLKEFTGTDRYFRDLLSGYTYSEGVKALADTCQAYWFLDIIFSYQPTKILVYEPF